MNPIELIQKEAIEGKFIFNVDSDIEKEYTILKRGQYIFDQSIGEFGGYKLNIILK